MWEINFGLKISNSVPFGSDQVSGTDVNLYVTYHSESSLRFV